MPDIFLIEHETTHNTVPVVTYVFMEEAVS